MNDQIPGLGTALRDRVADEHPDLDRLIAVSTRAGVRLRRRRATAAAIGGALTAVAVAGTVGVSLGGGGTAASDAGIATPPTAAASPSASASSRADELEAMSDRDLEAAHGRTAPVRVDTPGWRCDEPADQKFTCSQNGAAVQVTWRPAPEHVAYLDPAKAGVQDGVTTFVSNVNGPWFVTVAPAPGTTQEQVAQVGRGLTWLD